MIIDKKCNCGSKSTGTTTIRCCNLCGLPMPNEPWHFNLDENIMKIPEEIIKEKYPSLELPMIIKIMKTETDGGYYDGRRMHNGTLDYLFNYLQKKKIPFEEPKNKDGLYDRFIIKLETPEQALNLLLWDKFGTLEDIRRFSAEQI